MRIDLHVHSSVSKNPNEWILRKLGARESYTDPMDVYRIAKARGMSAVTITDHNSIEGCLAIAHLPDTFVSCEYTTYFPGDRCKVHVLCYNITPAQHERIQQIRSDIFAMLPFLKEEGILHVLAHPFFSPDGRLTVDHFCHLTEMFEVFEINGSKDSLANDYLRKALGASRAEYKLTGGSDDHSSLTIGNTWTEVPGAKSVSEFFERVASGKALVGGTASTPHCLAWHIYSVGWQWVKQANKTNGLSTVLDCYLLPPERQEHHSLVKRIWLNTMAMTPRKWGFTIPLNFINREFENIDTWSLRHLPLSSQWFEALDIITSKYFAKLGNNILDDISDQMFLGVFSKLGLPIGLYAALAPYFVAFGKFAAQRKLGRECLQFYSGRQDQQRRVAKFTDTYATVDGVSKTLEEQRRQAVQTGKDYTIITCVGEEEKPGLKTFRPVAMIATPEFDQQKLCWPPLLRMLDYCYKEQFTHIQAATPGPVGLAGMVIAKTLGLPFHAVYHTQIPEFIGRVTGDLFLEELAWKYCLWFYDSADIIFGPSKYTKDDLIGHGIRPEKIMVYPRGVDIELFHPARRSDYWERKWGLDRVAVKALYVGRVSKEKNLPLLVRAFKRLIEDLKKGGNGDASPPFTLIVVGDGAYSAAMKEDCEGWPALFTGELHGAELAEAFASADFLVFPSTTDTYGRVVIEAMASGIPCIVSDVGGPQENVVNGVNGLVVNADDEESLFEAMRDMVLISDRALMGRKARECSETRSFSSAFERYWQLYAA
jgi:glycosyltransferase involved in cell wall biosynthesis/predicted metal-dependent phosphoesterase TrpH